MNGKGHTVVGAVAGPVTGLGLAKRADRQVSGLEACGWVLGGIGGSKLPDLFEPAYCPHHRKFAHSGTVLAADLTFLSSETLESWVQKLKSKAVELRSQAALNPEYAIWSSLLAGLCEILAGVVPALFGGYASHLICDATTPFGIPLC